MLGSQRLCLLLYAEKRGNERLDKRRQFQQQGGFVLGREGIGIRPGFHEAVEEVGRVVGQPFREYAVKTDEAGSGVEVGKGQTEGEREGGSHSKSPGLCVSVVVIKGEAYNTL